MNLPQNSPQPPPYPDRNKKERTSKTHVLSVGINSFDDANIKNLQTAVSDAVLFLTGFRNSYSHNQLHSKELLNPTKKELKTNINDFLEPIKPEDQAFVYIASHGVIKDKEDNPKAYITCSDSERSNLESTAIEMIRLAELFNACPAQLVLFILDTCNSGAALADVKLEDNLQRLVNEAKENNPQANRAFLVSSRVLQKTREDLSRGEGFLITNIKKHFSQQLKKEFIHVPTALSEIIRKTNKLAESKGIQQEVRFKGDLGDVEIKALGFPDMLDTSDRSLSDITPSEPHFVGREGELKEITGWYKNKAIKVGAIIGVGGMGKSTLVREWYDQLQHNALYPQKILWFNFYRRNFEAFLNECLEYFGGEDLLEKYKDTDEYTKVSRIKKLINKHEFLLILDGVEQIHFREDFKRRIVKNPNDLGYFLRMIDTIENKGLALLTSRKEITQFYLSGGEKRYKEILIKSFNQKNIASFLNKKGLDTSKKDIALIYKKTGGHVLCTQLIVSLIAHRFKGDFSHIKKIPSFVDEKIKSYYTEKLKTTKIISILDWYVEIFSLQELSFMMMFSCFFTSVDQQDLNDIIFSEYGDLIDNMELAQLDTGRKTSLLEELETLKIINRELIGNSYIINPLVRDYFQFQWEKEKKADVHMLLVEHYKWKKENDPDKEDDYMEQLVLHALEAELYDIGLEEVIRLLPKLTEKLELERAYEIGIKALESIEQLRFVLQYQGVHPKVLQPQFKYPTIDKLDQLEQAFCFEIFEVFRDQGEYYAAHVLTQTIIKNHISDKTFVSDWDKFCLMMNLGETYYQLGEYDKAYKILDKTKQFCEKSNDLDYANMERILRNQAIIDEIQGEYKKALQKNTKSLIIALKLYGKKHMSIANTLNNLGIIFSIQGDYEKALKCYNSSVKIIKDIYGPKHIEIATNFNNIGIVYEDQELYNKAIEYYEKNLEISQKVYGDDHIEVADTLVNRGSVYYKQGFYKKALDDYNKSLNIIEKTYGKDHINSVEVLNNIGLVYRVQKQYQNALKHYEKAFELLLRYRPSASQDIEIVENNIVYIRQYI